MAEQTLEDFTLEPSDPNEVTAAPGTVPSEGTINELRSRLQVARSHAKGYGEACKAVAEAHKIKPSALKRYIAALEDDTTESVLEEVSDLDTLINHIQT